jgi:hypothetical protein
MWFLWTLIAFVVLGWIGYIWITILTTKYEHTLESRLTLLVLLALATFTGLRLTYVMAPVLSIWPRLILTVSLGSVIFIGFSFVAVHLWCAFLTRGFDDRIGLLEEEQDRLQTQLNILRFRQVNESVPLHVPDKAYETEYRAGTGELERLQEFLDEWQQAGGAARVRSIKVMEWKEEARTYTVEELQKEIRALGVESREETDEIKKEQAKARLAVMKMQIAQHSETRISNPETGSVSDQGVRALPEAESEILRRKLQNIHSDLQLTEAQKREFLRGKIRLSWRVRS